MRIEKAKTRAPDYGNKKRQYNDTNKVVINCLSWNTTSESLGNALSKFGPVEECNVPFRALVEG